MTNPDRPRCDARKRDGSGTTCTQAAGWGTDHPGTGPCKLHGGSTTSHRTAAREEMAARAVEFFGLPKDIDPGAALLDEVKRTAGVVAWLGAQIQRTIGEDPEHLVRGTKGVSRTVGRAAEGPVDTTTTAVGPQVHLWWEMWSKERAHLVKACTAALSAGIAERQVQLAEQAGERAGQWLRASLEVLGLSDADMRRVMAAGVSHLHLLEGTG